MRKWLAIAVLCAAPLAQAAELRALRVQDEPADSPGVTRVIFDLDGVSPVKIFTLENPQRVVVDFDSLSRSAIKRAQHTPVKGLVQALRSGPRDKGVRVVLDVGQAVKVQRFDPSPGSDAAQRLIVELSPLNPPAAAAASAPPAPAPAPAVAPAMASVAPPPARSEERLAPRGADKPVVVVIDAGHGGQDPGAHGPSGLQEKDVALAIARKLALLINAQPGMRAVLTRDGDYFLELRQRVEIARKNQADLFVSVHCNAFSRSEMSGTAVYVLSDRGVSSEQARWLANKENSADLVGGVELHGKDKQLAAVLIDLSQSATLEASFDVGTRILRSMGGVNNLQKPEVQQAAFVVLKAPDIPSVLVETAFITNPREERLLASDEYQSQLALSMLGGVKAYFQAYRPKQQLVQNEALIPVSAPAPFREASDRKQAAALRRALSEAPYAQPTRLQR